jgi:hypothetical protein
MAIDYYRFAVSRQQCWVCGRDNRLRIIGADVRPNCQERPARESITGMQWR